MGQIALLIDILRRSIREDACDKKGIIRLCTIHLEALESGTTPRKKQLQLISGHLKGCNEDNIIACGGTGGDSNSIQNREDLEPAEMSLTDAWTGFSELSSDVHLQRIDSHG